MDMYCPACGSGLVRKGTKTYQTLSDHITRLSAVTQPKENWKGNVARASVAHTMLKLGWSTDPVELADQEQ